MGSTVRTRFPATKARARIAATVAVCLSLALSAQAVAQSCVATVSPDNSIQDAIEAAGPGDTICVEAGTYNENLIINKPLTLLGKGPDSTTINPGTGFAILVQLDAPEETVRIEGFSISAPGASGIQLESTAVLGTLEVHDVVVTGSQHKGLGTGNNSDVGNIIITDSTFSGNGTGGAGGSGDISLINFTGDASLTNVTVTGDAAGSLGHYALQMKGTESCATPSEPAGSVSLTNVSFSGAYQQPPVYIQCYTDLAGLSFSNVIIDGPAGSGWAQMFVGSIQNGTPTPTLDLGDTDFIGTHNTAISLGDSSTGNLRVNATAVLFGGVLASGDPFAAEDRVTHALDDDTGRGLVVFVPDNLYVTQTSGSIQRGIDKATAGDTVNVAAGTYEEQLVISEDLTVQGAGPSETSIKAPSPLVEADGLPGRFFLVHVDGASVTIDGFTVDGTRSQSNAVLHASIFANNNASVTIQNNHITNTADDPLSGAQHGSGIIIGGQGVEFENAGTPATALIRDNLIDNYQKHGILAMRPGTHVDILNNTVTGQGPAAIAAATIGAHGINVSLEATGIVSSNTVTDVDSGGALTPAPIGIFIDRSGGVELIGNTIQRNERGIVTNGTPSTAASKANLNIITDNTLLGVDNVVDAVFDATNNWWGCRAGPGNPGCDTVGGPVDASFPLTAEIAGVEVPANVSNATTAVTPAVTLVNETNVAVEVAGDTNLEVGPNTVTVTSTLTVAGQVVDTDTAVVTVTRADAVLPEPDVDVEVENSVSAPVIEDTPTEVQTQSADGSTAKVTAPPGALPDGGTLTVAAISNVEQLIEQAPPPPGADLVVAFVIQAQDAEGQPITGLLDAPVELEFTVPAEALPDGANPENLVLAFWNGESWVEVAGAITTVNEDDSITVTATITHFSIFGLLVAQPVITDVSPDAGSIFGGTEVTITGSGFVDGMFVIFGEFPATDVVVAGDGTSLTARTPGARPGVVDVVVVIDEQFDVLEDAFTYSLLCTEVVVDNCFTEYSRNGGPMPENVIPEIQVGSVRISLVDADIPIDQGGGLDRFELSPTISNEDVLTLALKLDETFDDPIVAISTGRIEQWSWDAGNRVASIEIQPGPSSWSIDGCDPEVCAAQASIDYTSFVLISLDPMQLPDGAGEEFETFIAAMDGAFISTNAQFFSTPTFDFDAETLRVQVGAPSLKFDNTQNLGSFRTLVPYAVVTEVWGVSDPTVITDAESTVTVDGVEVDFSIEHVEASGFSPAGILFELVAFPYSAPIVEIKVEDVEEDADDAEPPEPPDPPELPEFAIPTMGIPALILLILAMLGTGLLYRRRLQP